uniref:Putative secreted protein n=1 Tax=Anopheles darlingi TaxID=43151 RepID=A0A2M4DE03_ANODA
MGGLSAFKRRPLTCYFCLLVHTHTSMHVHTHTHSVSRTARTSLVRPWDAERPPPDGLQVCTSVPCTGRTLANSSSGERTQIIGHNTAKANFCSTTHHIHTYTHTARPCVCVFGCKDFKDCSGGGVPRHEESVSL